MTYAVLFRRAAKKALERLSQIPRQRIKEVIRGLQNIPIPVGCRQLHTEEGKYYRIRIGQYRVIYEVAHEIRIVTVMRVGHRKEVYRGL